MYNFLRFALLTLIVFNAYAQTKPSYRICRIDTEAFPWVLKNEPGLYSIMLSLVAKQLGINIEEHVMPWKRCLATLQKGEVDGAVGASFMPERCQFGVYPGGNGCQDVPEMRAFLYVYPLYKYKFSALQWDGHRLSGQKRPIGVQLGYSITPVLKNLGAFLTKQKKNPLRFYAKLPRVFSMALRYKHQ